MKRILSLLCLFTLLGTLIQPAALMAQNADMPRVMVVIDEKIDNVDATARKVAGRIEKALLEKGYRIVDSRQFSEVRARDVAAADATKAKELGRRYGAELIIAGGAQSNFGGEKEVYGIKSNEFTADGEVKLIITDTGEILAVSSASSKKSSQGKAQAASKSLEEVGETLATELMAKIDAKMKEMKEKPIIVELILQGVNDATLVKIESELPGKISMIEKMKLRYMEGGSASYDVVMKGTLDDLRKAFSAMQDYSVVGASGNRIDVSTKTSGIKKTSTIMSSALEITEFKVENIFPAQFVYYSKNPIGAVTLENTGKADIKNIKAKIFIPNYMSFASEQMIPLLKAGEKKTFEVSATLDKDKLQSVSENTVAQIKTEISYNQGGEEKVRSITKPVTIYSKNSISWNKPTHVGAFVTYKDAAVENFSRNVVGTVKFDQTLYPNASRNMQNAMKIWDAVRSFSINYVSDPWVVAEGDVLDEIQFPRQTLAKKAGDCDDSSILLAACLENLGIRTMLIGTSDHIFIMFDTGVNKKNASRVSLNERDYVIRENTVWLPLETTIINKPFSEAWSMGASGYYKTVDANGKLDIIDVRKSWEMSPPSNLASDEKIAATPNASDIEKLLSADAQSINAANNEMASQKVAYLKSQNNEKSANEAAVILANAGKYDDAIAVIKMYSSASTKNNLGNIYLLKGDSANAVNNYTAALTADQKDGGINLNVGLLKYLGGDHSGTVESFADAVSKFPSQSEAYAELGIDNIVAEMGQTRAAEKSAFVDKGELQSLLFSALSDLQTRKEARTASRQVRRGENKFLFGGRRGIDPTALANIKDFLYWKI
jgi:tetratricopeptide (TPR) repeat protein